MVSLTTILVSFISLLAIVSLIRFKYLPVATIICALLWIVLVTAHLATCMHEGYGLRRYLIALLGSFSRDQFADLDEPDGYGCQPVLRLGFRLFGRRFFYDQIPIQSITSIEWTPGQATNLAGKDMDDWSVALWYLPVKPRQPRYEGDPRPGEDLVIVGPAQAKAETTSFGLDLVGFLAEAGLAMQQQSAGKYVPIG